MLSTSSFACAFFKCSNLDAMSLESYTLEAGCCLHLSFSNKQESYFHMHMMWEGGGDCIYSGIYYHKGRWVIALSVSGTQSPAYMSKSAALSCHSSNVSALFSRTSNLFSGLLSLYCSHFFYIKALWVLMFIVDYRLKQLPSMVVVDSRREGALNCMRNI